VSKGIDIPIDALVTRFTSDLWNGKTNVFKGRIQRTVRDGGSIPEWYNPTTKRYEDVLLNDRVDATVFFDVQPDEDYHSHYVAEVRICFAVNLAKLYPLITERATEYVHEAALKLIKKSRFNVTGLVRGLDAFSEYELVKESDNMNQFYLFRFNTTVKYPQNC
jgi:uncharacterized protein YtpQ (UPF0354 family)